MPWAPNLSLHAAQDCVDASLVVDGHQVGETNYAVVDEDDRFLGGVGLHARIGPGVLEVGYRVRADQVRRGIATVAAAALTEAALRLPEISSVEIHHDGPNRSSVQIPLRLGLRVIVVKRHELSVPGEVGVEYRLWMTRAQWRRSTGVALLDEAASVPAP